MPPVPTEYFNDYAHVVSSATASRLNHELAEFERATSSQLLVAIFPKMQSDSSLEDYTVRIAQSWKVGRQEKKNGAVLFVFIQDRKTRIEVGYGLEPVLTDALSKQIIENEISPRFRRGDFDGGLSAGVAAMMAAARGEYKGTGRTTGEGRPSGNGMLTIPFILFIVLMGLGVFIRRLQGGTVYRRTGYGHVGGWSSGTWGGFGGGGGGGGGSSDGFSGGGGSFGGGGASGRW